LRILRVNFLGALGDDEADAGDELGVGRRLSRRAAAFRATAHHYFEATFFDVIDGDDSAPQADQTIASQLFVVVIAGPRRSELVGRDVVEERQTPIEDKIFAGKLAPQKIGIGRQIENPPFEEQSLSLVVPSKLHLGRVALALRLRHGARLRSELQHHAQSELELVAGRLHGGGSERRLELDEPGTKIAVLALAPLRRRFPHPALDDFAKLVQIAFDQELGHLPRHRLAWIGRGLHAVSIT
jgi:hypothetical protein